MAELKPMEVIMRIDFAGTDGKQICAHAEKVQELVRCQDCKYWDTEGYGVEFENEGYGWCDHIERDTKADWFCADGKRKSDE